MRRQKMIPNDGAMDRVILRGRWAALAMAIAAVFPASAALAQAALERHPAEVPRQPPASVRIDEQDFGKASATPLGVDLAGVHLIGKDEALADQPAAGISGTPKDADAAQLQAALQPFLNQPLSLALASDVQAAIARVYRQSGYPFVSVTLPPQELTSGILQVRVIEFRMGSVVVAGTAPAEADAIRRRLRVEQGSRIDAGALQEDLDWLNRTPYRRAEGVFEPGEQTALSNLGVNITEAKPWQVFGSWSNSGTASTGRDRYSLGANAWLPLLGGTVLSYQLTTSADAWSHPGRMSLDTGDYPRYLSHAGRIVIPTFARQELEIAPGFVASRQRADAFITFENRTFELPVIYRSAVSNILPGRYWGDLYGGVEFKTLSRTTFFDTINIAKGNAELFQFAIGWSNTITDPYGRTAIDARIKMNPGGVMSGNDKQTWRTFSNGRIDDVTYAYQALDLTRVTVLPGNASWVSTFSGVLAGQPLPDTERFSLGGLYAVRGYNFDDVSIDSGFVWRNELRLAGISLLPPASGVRDGMSPYLFADLGNGKDRASGRHSTLGSVGAGFDYDISSHLSSALVVGYALKDAGLTEAGDWSVQARISARF